MKLRSIENQLIKSQNIFSTLGGDFGTSDIFDEDFDPTIEIEGKTFNIHLDLLP